MFRRISILLIFQFSFVFLKAQTVLTERFTSFIPADTVRIDTLSLQPGFFTLICGTDTISPDAYILYKASSILVLKPGISARLSSKCSMLKAYYKVFPFLFTKEVYSKKQVAAKPGLTRDSLAYYLYDLKTVTDEDENVFKFDGLDKNGSLSRGITVGNAQGLAVNSALNLQLSGKLAGDIEIMAAITDENIPVQPDGNTQQLQDFDKVFVQISKDRHKMIAGDFFVSRPNSYFLNIFKRSQGLQLSTAFDNKTIFTGVKKVPAGELRASASGAIARGKFARNQIQGIEGNQGPYRLIGNEGEPFIIVLSGSEKVFIDGRLLKRGQENEYIIDYNTAEITFTARQQITKDRRIVIEFEYSDRNYARTLYHINQEWDLGKFRYRFNVFSEQDSKNQPLQQSLSDSQKNLLSDIGDSLNQAVSPAVQFVDFNLNEVLYKKLDTLINGVEDTIYVYSTNPDSARYRLSFSNVGAGKGSYNPLNSTANGKVYQFVGKNQGSYDPVIRLITPKLHRMITFGADYKITRTLIADGEIALSTNDLNTFSSKGNNDNNAVAFRVNLTNRSPLSKKDSTKSSLRTRVWYEQVQAGFVPFIRFRNVEFNRDWNLNLLNQKPANEYIPGIELEYKQAGLGSIQYTLNGYFRGADYKSFRNQIVARLEGKKRKLDFWGSQTQTFGEQVKSAFWRHRTSFLRKFGFVAAGVIGEDEYNVFRSTATDSLRGNSYMFNDWQTFIGSADSSALYWRVFYRARIDHLPSANRLDLAATAHSGGFDLNYTRNSLQQIRTNLTYRYLKVMNSNIFSQPEENSAVGRIDYSGRFFKNTISVNTYYEVGSGLENKRQFSFLPVNNGQGTHYWDLSLDYNKNGVPDLDEFQPAQFQGQGNYIKVFTPTAIYVKTFNTQFNTSINLKAPDKWKLKKGFVKFISRFSNQFVFRAARKSQDPSFSRALNPLSSGIGDTSLLSLSTNLRNTLYFNRNDSKFGTDISYIDNRNKALLVNGVDTRAQQAWNLRTRWNINRTFTINTEAERGRKYYESQFLRSRNFDIAYLKAEPVLVIQTGTRFRISFKYNIQHKINRADSSAQGGQRALLHTAGTEINLNFTGKGLITARLNYVNISYNAPLNNALAFEMLDALAPGNNGTWNLSVQYTLGKNLQLTVNYEGRAGSFRPVHVGGMQVRAFF